MFTCDICKKSFNKKMALCGHKRIHNNKPYIRKTKNKLKIGDSNIIRHNCQFCGKKYSTGVKLGGHVSHCPKNPNTLETNKKHGFVWRGKKLSEEHKKKIGFSVRKYLTENPDQVPYLLNHSSKGPSYPELYFTDLFKKENIKLEFMFPFLSYTLDFCDSIQKIDIEIDGEQHYVDRRIIEHDKRRNQRLLDSGWRIYRIRWSKYKALSFKEKQKEIQKLKNFMGA